MNILFICTGNSCRSPMAEHIAREVFRRKGVKADFASAGVSVLMSLPASGHASDICEKYGADMSGFRTKQVTDGHIEWADLILTMTHRHKTYMRLNSVREPVRLYTLGEYLGDNDLEIPDPFGGDADTYRSCADTLEEAIMRLADKVNTETSAPQRIAVGSDHAGYGLKIGLIEYLRSSGWEVKDFGTNGTESADYPIFAREVAGAVVSGAYPKGLLICGTGIGISIAANRISGVRCALCHDVFSAKASRDHNDANILAMGGRVIGIGHATEILKAFLETGFSDEENHKRRIGMLDSQ